MLKIKGTIIGTMLIHKDTSPFWKTLTQPLFSIGEKTPYCKRLLSSLLS